MEITRDQNLIEFKPENEKEAKQLEELWRMVVDCAKFNKKLVPVGEYLPPQKNIARFVVEES